MRIAEADSSSAREQELEARLARMQAALAATSGRLADVINERDNLRHAYRQLMEQFELLRRRIFVAKAERVDATQLELEFEKTKKKLEALSAELGAVDETVASVDPTGDELGSRPSGKPPTSSKAKPKGRRNLADVDHLPERRVEIRDAELERLGTFIGWETSYKLGYQRPEAVRVVIARAKYKMKQEPPAPGTRPVDTTVLIGIGAPSIPWRAPPTPPGVRVRTGRFGELRLRGEPGKS